MGGHWTNLNWSTDRRVGRSIAALPLLLFHPTIHLPINPLTQTLDSTLPQILRLKPGRRFCTLGRLASEVGWGHKDLVQRLESKRKVRGCC